MPITNYLPSSRLIQPGVCTSSTRPASPFHGQVIYETDTKQTLVYNGSAWVMLTDADTPPGLELVKTQTIGTTVSSVTVSDVFSATYENYRIIVSGGVGSTAAGVYLQLGSSTTGYYSAQAYTLFSTDGIAYLRDNNGANWNSAGGAYTDGLAMDIDLIGPFATRKTGMAMNSRIDYRTNGAGVLVGNGFHNVSASYTSFVIAPTVGTITGGTIRVYGYRNS